MVVLLVDDERSFKDGRECVTVRSVDEAIDFTEGLSSVDELWLDYILLGTDSADAFLFHLLRRKASGNPLLIKKAYIHTSSYMAVGLLEALLNDLDVPTAAIKRVDHNLVFETK